MIVTKKIKTIATAINIGIALLLVIILAVVVTIHSLGWTEDLVWDYRAEYEEVEVINVERGELKYNARNRPYYDGPSVWTTTKRRQVLTEDYWMLAKDWHMAISKGDIILIRWNVYNRANFADDWKFQHIIKIMVDV